jgi:hypothetical protein
LSWSAILPFILPYNILVGVQEVPLMIPQSYFQILHYVTQGLTYYSKRRPHSWPVRFIKSLLLPKLCSSKPQAIEKKALYNINYRIIHKSLRKFRPLRCSSRDGHAEGEHVNKGRDTPSFSPNLQVLDKSTIGDAADVNSVIMFLPHTVNHVA